MKSKMKLFVTKVNGWKLLIFVTKGSILDSMVELDASLILVDYKIFFYPSSLSIAITSLTTFKGYNIIAFFLESI